MRKIKPVKVFNNGEFAELTFITVTSSFDNLLDFVKFEYSVYTADATPAGGGNVVLDGLHDYQTWDASANGAYKIVAEKVGFDLAGGE